VEPQSPSIVPPRKSREHSATLGFVMGIVMIPVLLLGGCLAFPYIFILGWLRKRREQAFRALMRSQGRMVPWAKFLRSMRTDGGTCIEERFSPKGPVRFWWTPENVFAESPHDIIDWFTMRKGRQFEPFIHWCRARYTSPDTGAAIFVDTFGVPRKDIYTLWSECRSEASKARWVEVPPPEILPHRPGQ